MPSNPEVYPVTTVVLAMSADGKIADATRSPARFGSAQDQAQLELQIAESDAVLFGANTLRAYGTTLRVSQPELLEQRRQRGQPSQPIQMVCSQSADLDPQWRFFQQPVPRWLLTDALGAQRWHQDPAFERILVAEAIAAPNGFNWPALFHQLTQLQLKKLAVLGGGTLAAALFAADLVDELRLTVCPLILGGAAAPTPVAGLGFAEPMAPRLQLLAARSFANEVFLHYRVQKRSAPSLESQTSP